MKIETLRLGQLQTNCYLVYDPQSNEGMIIDPADEAEFIAEKVQTLKFNPKAIIATHGHFDHVLAAGELQLLLNKFEILNPKFQMVRQAHHPEQSRGTNSKFEIQNSKLIPFYIHQNDLFLLKQMNQSASHWLGLPINKPLPTNIRFLKENEEIKFGNFALKVIETPGHTPGSVCFVDAYNVGVGHDRPEKRRVLFSGDTLFKNGIGRYDFSYSSKEKLDQSLQKIFKLPKETLVCPGHGKETKIEEEKYSSIS